MTQIEVRVAGREIFNDDIPGWQTTPTPPPAPPMAGALRAMPAQIRQALLLALGKAMHKAIAEGLLQPVRVKFEPRATGFTITADIT